MNIDNAMKRMLDHLWGPVGSVLLHILILVLLINLLVFERPPASEPATKVTVAENTPISLRPPPELPNDPERKQNPERPKLLEPSPSNPLCPPDNADVAPADGVDAPIRISTPRIPVDTGIPHRSDDEIKQALSQYSGGMGDRTEPAVRRALAWLKKHQIREGERKGAWMPGREEGSEEEYAAVTALGLLAFLAHGENTGSSEYGDTVRTAIQYLIEKQRDHGPEGAFCRLNKHGVYAHAIATYAISESFAMTRIPELKQAMNAAVEVIIEGQQSGGGWDYAYRQGSRRDTSVASWQVQALKAALMAGSDVQGLKASIAKSGADLKQSFVVERGAFRYTRSGISECSTSMGALCLQLIGFRRSDQVFEAMEHLEDSECSWNVESKWAMYNWYYLTQAKFHHGGSDWDKWNREFAQAYVENQAEDGHWDPPVEKDRGHGDGSFGRAFTTSLGALTLQVYYRLLPTYKRTATRKIDPSGNEQQGEEIKVDII